MPRVGVDGTDEVAKSLEALGRKYGDAVARAAVEAAHIVQGDAIKSIQDASAGNVVTRHQAGSGEPYQHTAAEEGSAPNTDTGALVKSINVEVRHDGVFVGSTLKYAGWLEFGTRQMGARPWLNPALEKNRDNILKTFKIEVGKVK